MAEERIREFNTALTSFEENKRLLGLIEPGIYRGFDVATFFGLGITLTHGAKGIVQTNSDNISQTSAKGVIVTRHGVVVQEDAQQAFTLSSNATNANTRYDLIIFEHEWLGSTGGQAGVYSVVEGPMGSPVLPALPDPMTQIIIGVVEIPANAANLNDAVWTRYRNKSLGGGLPALLDELNEFTGFNAFPDAGSSATYDGSTEVITLGKGTTHVINLGANVNVKDLVDNNGLPLPNGTLLMVNMRSTGGQINLKGSGASGKFANFYGASSGYTSAAEYVILGFYFTGWMALLKVGGTWQVVSANEFGMQTKANRTQTAWANLTLLNGWAAEGSGTYFAPGYFKDEFGIVHLRGILDNTGAALITVAQLPAGHFPSKSVVLHGLDSSGATSKAVLINNTGAIAIATSGGPLISLDGLSFKAD